MSSSAPATGDTLAERAAQLVEADIVSGALAPGARLGIAEMAARYQIGATPLREGLSRLAARGLVDAFGMRGFRVKGISREDLQDIVVIRSTIEREALKRSLELGGGGWEGEIAAALQRLKHVLRRQPKGLGERDPEFDRLHKAFHASLIAACRSPRLIAAQAQLYDQAQRYRRLMMSGIADSDGFLVEHERLADLAIHRDRDAALAAIANHIASTLAFVYPERDREDS